jgi:hypothetical protein
LLVCYTMWIWAGPPMNFTFENITLSIEKNNHLLTRKILIDLFIFLRVAALQNFALSAQ